MPSRDLPDHRAAWLAAAALAALVATAPTGAAELRAHDVFYQFLFKGMSGGDLELKLTPDTQPDSWHYETHAHPNFLASFFVSPNSVERGTFRVTPSGVEPQRYLLRSGSSDKSVDAKLTYDWVHGRVFGEARGSPLELAIEPGTQDVLSIRAAILVDLLAGREPHEYEMIDGRELKRFVYTRVGPARLKTDIGELDTVIFKSARKGADARERTWRYWYAPSLGWLPVRAEQREGDKTRVALVIRSLKWLDAAPPGASPPE